MRNTIDFNLYWVMKYPDGSFVGIDDSSGGYPYKTSYPSGIKWWTNTKEAERYIQMFPDKGFKLYRVVHLVIQEVIENG